MTIREIGQHPYRASALPAYTVPTREDAEHLQVWFCKLSYDGRYVLPQFGGKIQDLVLVGDMFKREYERREEATKPYVNPSAKTS